MASGIFTIREGGVLKESVERTFLDEDSFQELLETYPSLLAGDQVDPERPRRWLLVKREMGVPDEVEASNRWSADHLFLDQDAIPTIVEVKRSTDTRIRREVVGQMLDYAANSVVYWNVASLRDAYEKRCAKEGKSSDQEFANFLGQEADAEAYWEQVKTNLQAGKVRLLFVADSIPPELRRIVAFLNEQMDPAEVLALELKQYEGDGLRTLIPRVYGQVEGSRREQTRAAGKRWDEGLFLDDLERKAPGGSAVARQIIDWSKAHGLRLWWGKGNIDGSCFPMFDHKGETHWYAALWSNGQVQMQFQMISRRAPFSPLEARKELQQRLNQISGVSIADDRLERFPAFPISTLVPPQAMAQFLKTFEWYLQQVRGS